MVTNPIFNPFGGKTEQELFHSLLVESIKIYGQDMYYIPWRETNLDKIYGEDDSPHFDTAYQIEIYIKKTDGFGGQGSFLSPYGLEIRDQTVFSIAIRTFENEILSAEPDLIRPREGDLVYFPLNKKCFEVKYVDKFEMFYPLGTLYMYNLNCELFEYSNEIFTTGIEEIDALQKNRSFNAFDYALTDETGLALTNENGDILVIDEFDSLIQSNDPLSDNQRIETEVARNSANSLIDWTELTDFTGSSDKKY